MSCSTRVVVDALRQAELPNAEALAELAAPSCRITAERCPLAQLPLGASRFGGSPDVTEGFEWPTHRERSLTFLAEFDLSTVKTAGLPTTGWLLFFYDVAEQPRGYDPLHAGGARVFYLNGPRDALRRIEHPDVRHAGGPFECCRLTFRDTVELPSLEDRELENLREPLEEPLASRYRDATNQLAGQGPIHHLLGHPQLLQDDMRGQCQLVTHGLYCGDRSGFRHQRAPELLADAAASWRLLLQLDTDEQPDWEWGESGRIYFWIRQSDLAENAFAHVWLVLQGE